MFPKYLELETIANGCESIEGLNLEELRTLSKRMMILLLVNVMVTNRGGLTKCQLR